MADAMTTIVSRSSIPEKVQEVIERASENKQQALTAVVQEEAERRVKTVRKMDSVSITRQIKRKKEDDTDAKKDEQHQNEEEKKKNQGSHLDLKA